MVMGSEVNGSLCHRTPAELKHKQLDVQEPSMESEIEAIVVEAAKVSN